MEGHTGGGGTGGLLRVEADQDGTELSTLSTLPPEVGPRGLGADPPDRSAQ
jgi:hypothetical protein